jgi:deoxyribodipyrimidine photo-lyase
VASNYLNWQWVAGTGTDSNPHRILNPSTQAKRFDSDAAYIRRWVPELSGLKDADALDPSPSLRKEVGYPLAIVDHHERVELFKQRRLTNVA